MTDTTPSGSPNRTGVGRQKSLRPRCAKGTVWNKTLKRCIAKNVKWHKISDGKFSGEWWVENEVPKRGILHYQNGNVFDGEFSEKGHRIKGVMEYKNGNVYDGEWKDYGPDGQGVMTYSSDVLKRFEGLWKESSPEKGVMEYKDGNVYDGEWKDRLADGQGVMTYSSDVFKRFEGLWKKSNPEKGVMEYKNGNVYDGEWKDGEADGQGVMTYSSDVLKRFEGQWKKSNPEKGVMEYKNGEVYDGEWKDGEADGQGVMTYSSNSTLKRFEGLWKKSNPEKGVMEYKNGNVYDGEWKDGLTDGQGVMTYSSNITLKRFEGLWKKSYPEKGVMEYKNGNVYDGEWKDDGPDGQGVMTYSSNSTFKRFEGLWKKSKPEKGVMEYKNGNVYDGEFKDDEKNGEGVFTSKNGDRYDGEFEDDEMNGEGVMTYANGDVYDGEWENDHPNGLGHYKYKQYTTKEYEGHFYQGKRHGKGRMILDGKEEPMRTWEHDNVVTIDRRRNGIAYEVHEASDKINLANYENVLREFDLLHDVPFISNIREEFASFIHDHADRFSDDPHIIEKINEILGKISVAEFSSTWSFLFAQPDDFVEFYIKAFAQDCYHAYDGENGMSCANGIKERVYMIIGDAAFAFCADPDHCTNPTYAKLTKVFHKHIDKNEFTKEWANQITPDILAMNTKKRKNHYIAFMKQKYKELDMYNIDTRKEIRKAADMLDHVFDKEKNPDMEFGGGRRRRTVYKLLGSSKGSYVHRYPKAIRPCRTRRKR